LSARAQRLDSRLTIEVTCIDEPCRSAARATVAVPKLGAREARTYASLVSRTTIAAGKRARVVIRVSSRIRTAARRALNAGRNVRARVIVVLTDAHRNRRTLSRRIAVRR